MASLLYVHHIVSNLTIVVEKWAQNSGQAVVYNSIYLSHPGSELCNFIVGEFLVDDLGYDPDYLPVFPGLPRRSEGGEGLLGTPLHVHIGSL